ncbi:hypothetical protein NJB14197_16110 [Mycobacterium montefiorense]|uniref:PPE domain-containing protein n=1 Tax=Mycobacterium montefiorense TaxID=154654 RepID=A0AA37UQL1_9MYCO|nr:hypothetical protein MmonteBS_52130 [Mycobacterium montefiorense]GKU33455.1 hypothetical protein NJB14191_08020 [Mycobacterium montefiorense]GKU39951.1 hypothetical protein NJB14192_19400 [Mycobacterium montefiorense]GKU45287.1 hypothetical protein NJB14194_19100 [Mycobacterium montefiorense]GKU49346.1 hypothetical protein NJB14195_05930 [Mycobacterium montefiorense]
MLAAAAGWDALAAQLETAASGYSSEISGLTGWWFGPSSMRMATAAAPYIGWLHASAAQAGQTAAQAYGAAAAYEAALSMTVPPPAIVANRAQLMALIATNFLGQNTPAIAVTEAQYMEMWVQDATAMYAYAADSEVASTLAPYDEPPQTTNQSGQADQTAAVARAASDATSARTQAAVQLASSAEAGDTTLPVGSSAGVAPGGAVLEPGVTVTVTADYPAVTTAFGVQVKTITDVTWSYFGFTYTIPAGIETNFAGGGFFEGGTFTVLPPLTGDAAVMMPAGGVTALGPGVTVTVDAGGFVTAVNTGAITSSAAITPIAPVAPIASSASGAVAVAPAAAAPGLAGTAGTAGIQAPVNVEGMFQWAQPVTEVAIAAG